MLSTPDILTYEVIPYDDDITDQRAYEIMIALIDGRLVVTDDIIFKGVTMSYTTEKSTTIIAEIITVCGGKVIPDVIKIEVGGSGELIYLHKLNLETTSF